MKKISLILAVIGMIFVSSCEGPPGRDGLDGQDGLLAEVFELKNVDFNYNATDGYTIFRALTPEILASDNILIYRMNGSVDVNTPIWQLIPRTLFLTEGELDYDFDFSKKDFTIYAGGNYNISTTPQYIKNQTFRIVIVPGSFSTLINRSIYGDVMAVLKVNESQVS